MDEVLEIFKKITAIPHCSFKTEKLKEFLVKECKSRGAEVFVDSGGNILAKKGKPSICLQSHYDMVCVGKAPDIEIVEEDGYLRAKDSSLGADNGIGVAMMLYMLSKKDDLELLFTNDEEVGLLGANALELKISSKYLLNLDSEEEGDICLGCAGGVDITVKKAYKTKKCDSSLKSYKVEAINFKGGHSGVDIDKGIKNAIKEVSYFLKRNSCKISHIKAGEAQNAIPKHFTAKVLTNKTLTSTQNIKVEKIEPIGEVLDISDELLDFLVAFASGVRNYDKELSLVKSSINLATIKMDKDSIFIEISPRAMSEEEMDDLILETTVFLEKFGFEYELSNRYPAWKPYRGEFASMVKKASEKVFGDVKFYAIHAGLECGVILSKNPHLEAVSIGPTIHFPHSTSEEVKIDSIKKVLSVLQELL